MSKSANRKLRERGETREEMDLVLKYRDSIRQFYCPACRFGLFKSQFRAVYLAPSLGDGVFPLTAAISIQCPQCGTVYHLKLVTG